MYAPSWDESTLASRHAKGATARLGFLVLLKTYQRLGYPAPRADVPGVIVEHSARSVNLPAAALEPVSYDAAGTRCRRLVVIREYLRVRPFGPAARHLLIRALAEAARTRGCSVSTVRRRQEAALDWLLELLDQQPREATPQREISTL